jgi:hypothetical protein
MSKIIIEDNRYSKTYTYRVNDKNDEKSIFRGTKFILPLQTA